MTIPKRREGGREGGRAGGRVFSQCTIEKKKGGREEGREGGRVLTYQKLLDRQVMPLLQDQLLFKLPLGGLCVFLLLPLAFTRLW